MNQCSACIFDFDGTIADTHRDVVESFRLAFDRCGVAAKEFDPNIIMQFQLPDAVAMLAPDASEEERQTIMATFRAIYDQSSYPNTTLMPTVADFLEKLRERSITSYIVTNKRRPPTMRILEKFGLTDCFAAIYNPDSFETRFKKSDLLALMLKTFGIEAGAASYIGDTEGDVVAARAVGLPSIIVRNGYGDPKHFSVSPDHVVSRIIDALPLLCEECGERNRV